MSRFYHLSIYTLFICLLFHTSVFAQNQTIEITDIDFLQAADSGYVDIFFSLRDESGSMEFDNLQDLLTATEENLTKGDGVKHPLEIIKGSLANLKLKTEPKDKNRGNDRRIKQEITIIIAMDHSGSMSKEMMDNAKQAVKSIFNPNIPDGSIWFSTFDNVVHDSKYLSPKNYDDVVGLLNPHRREFGFNPNEFDTDLFSCIIEKIKEFEIHPEMKDKGGKRVLIILTDGQNDTEGLPKYQGLTPPEAEDVFRIAAEKDIIIYTIGFGENADRNFLEQLPKKSKNPDGKYYYKMLDQELSVVYEDILNKVWADYRISAIPIEKKFSGNEREICLTLTDLTKNLTLTACKSYRGGSPTNIVSLPDYPPPQAEQTDLDTPKASSFLKSLLLGLLLLLILLLFSAVIYPWFRRQKFKREFVRIFPDSEWDTYCPFCSDKLKTGEKIVEKCQHTIHLKCWDKNGHHCTEYPSKCNIGTEGSFGLNDFFRQKGNSKYLNWMFFGAVAGFFSWMLLHFTSGSSAFVAVTENILSIFDSSAKNNAPLYADNTLTGLIVGFFLFLFFSIVETVRNFSAQKIPNLILRAVGGGVLGYVLFFIGSYIFIALNIDYFSHLTAWLIFGTLVGGGMSLGSSIQLKNGLLAGFVASVLAFHIYYLLSFQADFGEPGKVISLMLYGLFLGLIISLVVAMLERISLEMMNGKNRGQKIPISKWLKKGQKITIGRADTSIVALDWEHKIGEQQAVIFFDKQQRKAYVADIRSSLPTFLNGKPMSSNQDYPLNNGDILKFGDTYLMYIEMQR